MQHVRQCGANNVRMSDRDHLARLRQLVGKLGVAKSIMMPSGAIQ